MIGLFPMCSVILLCRRQSPAVIRAVSCRALLHVFLGATEVSLKKVPLLPFAGQLTVDSSVHKNSLINGGVS